MDDVAGAKLRQLLTPSVQDELLADPRRLAELVRERLGTDRRREASFLNTVMQEGVPRRLLSMPAGSLTSAMIANYARKVSEDTGLKEDVARASIETWASGLGLIIASSDPQPHQAPMDAGSGAAVPPSAVEAGAGPSHPAVAAEPAADPRVLPWWSYLSLASFLGPICLVLLYMPVTGILHSFADWRSSGAVFLGLLLFWSDRYFRSLNAWLTCAAITVLASLAAVVSQMNYGSTAEQAIAIVGLLGSIVGLASSLVSVQQRIKIY